MMLKDLPKAEKYLTTLASMDYTFRDTSALLERLHRMIEQENQGKQGEDETKKKKKDKDDEKNDEE